ncbi:hypothetical protein OH77DRAFT_1032616 [Trametes cingulata]|nr:hypothetical protein OH77DRAFT_1032616 [Trametes cingulata]
MSARRQASTTSLSRYARAGSPDFTNRSLDFCNAFWGLGDGGVEVLFARMRGAMRTMEELKNFWKERAAIEEQYAKRLAGLAKLTLGRDEIGYVHLPHFARLQAIGMAPNRLASNSRHFRSTLRLSQTTAGPMSIDPPTVVNDPAWRQSQSTGSSE